MLGLRCTSVPLTVCSRMPPPLPLSAVLPMIRLLSITRPGPVPSLRPGAQSTSDHDAAAVGRDRNVVALIEQDPVVGNIAVIAEAFVRQAATVTGAQVAAHP